MTGVVRAFVGLAYDLYLSAHNAELPALLLTRLRNAKTFEGALYEASVIGTFAKPALRSNSRMKATRLSRIASSSPLTR